MTDDSIPLKQCSKCKEWKPATTEYFHRGKASQDGLYHHCKACRKANFPKKPPRIHEELPEGHRRCSHCKQLLLATNEYFYRDTRDPQGLQRQCKRCTAEIGRNHTPRPKGPEGYKRCPRCQEWKSATLEFFTANKSERSGLNTYCKPCWNTMHRRHPLVVDDIPEGYKRCTKCKEIRPATSEYFPYSATCRNGLETCCRNCHHDASSSHYQHNKGRYNACLHRYRARKISNGGSHTDQDIKRQYEHQKGKCYWCHKKLTKYHVDHIVPLSRGGTDDPWNIVIACPTCNISRGAKLPHEWPQGGRLL